MTNRRRNFLTIITVALVALFLPVMASAQGNNDPWGRDRDYRRDRNNDDHWYGNDDYNNGRYGRQDLRGSIRRLDNLSSNLERDMDRFLDHSREDGTRHEDHANSEVQEFRRATNDLRNKFDDGRNLNRSANEARRVLQIAQHLSPELSRHSREDSRIASDWSQIRQELRVIANAYNNNRGGNYGRNDGYNNRDGGYYGNDDDYNRRREEQRRREEEQRRRQNRSRVGGIFRNFPN